MSEITKRLTTAIAGRCRIERELGTDGMFATESRDLAGAVTESYAQGTSLERPNEPSRGYQPR